MKFNRISAKINKLKNSDSSRWEYASEFYILERIQSLEPILTV